MLIDFSIGRSGFTLCSVASVFLLATMPMAKQTQHKLVDDVARKYRGGGVGGGGGRDMRGGGGGRKWYKALMR